MTLYESIYAKLSKILFSNYIFKIYQVLKNVFDNKYLTVVPVIFNQDVINSSIDSEHSILLISQELTRTGSPLLLFNIAKTLKKEFNKNITLITLTGGDLQKDFENFCTVVNLNQSSLLKIKNKQLVDEVFCVLAKNKVSFALGNTICSAFFVPFLEKYNFNYKILIHELPNIINRFNWDKNALALLCSMSKGIIVYSSKYVLDLHRRQYNNLPKYVEIIPQGMFQNVKCIINNTSKLKLLKKYNLPLGTKIIFNGSNDLFRKGADLFYDIAKLVTEQRNDIVFIYLCDRQSLKYKLMFGSEIFAGNKIIFDDLAEDYLLYLEGSDIFALTSREDPFPNVLLDSLAHGLPLIAFDKCGGAPELLLEISDHLVAKTLDINDFANKIMYLLDNKDTYGDISSCSEQIIRHNYQFDKYVEKLLLH